MKPCSIALLFTLLLGSPQLSQAIVIRDDVGDAVAQSLGGSAAYASVGKLDRSGDITSGVLINPLFVLTAKHLVPNGTAANAFTFTIGGNDYTSAGYTLSNDDDLAIIQLAVAVPNVTPALVYTGSSEGGKLATMVGFGQGGIGSTGATTGRGTKRAATNTIDATDGTGRVLYSDFDSPAGSDNTLLTNYAISSSATPTAYEGLIAPGDSGGGTFATIDSQLYLIGIHAGVSFEGGGPNFNYGDLSADTRVSTAMPFIQSVVPEPTSLACLALGLAVLGARRNRQ